MVSYQDLNIKTTQPSVVKNTPLSWRTTADDAYNVSIVTDGDSPEWDMGDGTVKVAETFEHTYSAADEKTVNVVIPHVEKVTKVQILDEEDYSVAGQLDLRHLSRFLKLDSLLASTTTCVYGTVLSGTSHIPFSVIGAAKELPRTMKTLSLGKTQSRIVGNMSDLPADMGRLNLDYTQSALIGNLHDMANAFFIGLANTKSSVHGRLDQFPATLDYINLANTDSKLIGGDVANEPLCVDVEYINLNNTGMTEAQIDNLIDYIHAHRDLWTVTTPILDIGGASNAIPSAGAQTKITDLETDPGTEGFETWDITFRAA